MTLDLTQINTAKNLIHKDLIAIASLLTMQDLADLDWNIITGVENEDTIYLYEANDAVARQYKAGNYIKAKLGKVSQRKLKIKNVWTQIYQNIQNFREKEPISCVAVSETGALNVPVCEFLLRTMAKQFASQNLRNTVFGDETLGDTSPYSLFNGLNKLIKNEITATTVSTTKGNLQTLGNVDLTAGTDAAKVAAYEAFDKFVLNMDADLADADKVNVMVGRTMFDYITQGAALKFSHMAQLIAQNNNGTSFFNRQNIVLKPTKLMGSGQEMVAYTPGVIDFASDMTRVGDPSSAFIDLKTAQEDSNILIAQMQVGLGMRINNINSANFCVGLKDSTTFNTGKTLTESVETGTAAGGSDTVLLSKAELETLIAEKIAAASTSGS